jgi:hypothetical protein
MYVSDCTHFHQTGDTGHHSDVASDVEKKSKIVNLPAFAFTGCFRYCCSGISGFNSEPFTAVDRISSGGALSRSVYQSRDRHQDIPIVLSPRTHQGYLL